MDKIVTLVSVGTTHLPIIVALSLIHEGAWLLEKPLFLRTPVIILKGLIASGWRELLPCHFSKRNEISARFDFPECHGTHLLVVKMIA